jgi:DNA-binding transcriptional regulator YiaG
MRTESLDWDMTTLRPGITGTDADDFVKAGPTVSEGFAGMLARLRGRTRLNQRELAARTQVHLRSVQLWEEGINCPSARNLRMLIVVLLEAHALTPGREHAEAASLWQAAEEASSCVNASFDGGIEMAQSYSRGIGFAIGLILLEPLFLVILGFGDDRYLGPAARAAQLLAAGTT